MNSFGGRRLLASAVAAALVPVTGQAAVGRVDFAVGDVVRVDAQGNEGRLARGAEVRQGDTIRTAIGRAQIRFTDGAYTSLLPNSEFRVDQYSFEQGKEAESTGFFSLLKGGLRTITGAIGKVRKDAYKVATPVATIGIRGTEYVAVLGNSLTIWVGGGGVEACNNDGCTGSDEGGQIYITDENTRGIIVDDKPDTSTGEEVAQSEYSGPEETTPDGTPNVVQEVVTPPPPPVPTFEDGPFYALAIAIGEGTEGGSAAVAGYPIVGSDGPVTAAFTGGTELESYSGKGFGSDVGGDIGTASVFDSGNDGTGTVFWGRWSSGTINLSGFVGEGCCFGAGPLTLSGSETHAYAGGLPTTDMPTTGTASYDLLGGTRPAYADGSGLGTLNGATLIANFSTSAVDVNLDISIDGNDFMMDSGLGGNVRIGAAEGRAAHMFAGQGFFTSSSACSGGCFSAVEGFFAGAGASRAGLSYKVYDESIGEYFVGAAGFKRAAE